MISKSQSGMLALSAHDGALCFADTLHIDKSEPGDYD